MKNETKNVQEPAVAKKAPRGHRKWTVASASAHIAFAKVKGLTYWSAKDFLKTHAPKESV